MEAAELRIGNYVKHENYTDEDYLIVSEIKNNHIKAVFFDKNGCAYNGFEPIPLTEEWLEKFGFEKKEPIKWFGNGYDWQPKDNWTIQNDYVLNTKDDYDFIFRFETWHYNDDTTTTEIHFGTWYPKCAEIIRTLKDIKFVHQLQNLYFALTGDELTLTDGR